MIFCLTCVNTYQLPVPLSPELVVPPAQAQKIYDLIKARNGICDIVLYPGEGHGFRRAENKKDSMEKELEWYRTTFKISGGKE